MHVFAIVRLLQFFDFFVNKRFTSNARINVDNMTASVACSKRVIRMHFDLAFWSSHFQIIMLAGKDCTIYTAIYVRT